MGHRHKSGDGMTSHAHYLFKLPEGIGAYVGRRVEWLRDSLGVTHGTHGTITGLRGLGRLTIRTDDGRTVTVGGWHVVRVLPEERS